MEANRRDVLAMMTAAGIVQPGLGQARTQTPAAPVAPYTAACVQTRIHQTHALDGTFIPEALRANVRRVVDAIDRGAGEVGARLFIFSEFCFQLQTGVLTAQQWETGAIRLDGPEIAAVAAAAQRARAYVMVNPVERIDAFPGRYFLSGVLIGPNGDVLLNYRKLYDLSNKTRPTDILNSWIDKFGPGSLFPVADTPIGRLACTVGTDVVWPEMIRSLVFNGAELIGNLFGSPLRAPSFISERGPDAPDQNDLTLPTMARRVRAYENMAYMLSTNMGPTGSDEKAPLKPMQPTEIVDFRGNLLARSRDAAECFVIAKIDIEALRKARTTVGPANTLAQLQVELHRPGYDKAHFATLDQFANRPLITGDEHVRTEAADIEALVRRGVFQAPAG